MVTDLTVGTQADPTGTVIAVSGEMDLRNWSRLRQAISHALAGEPGILTVDLAGLTFCDSMGISALVTGRHQADACHVGYRVVNAHGIVAHALEITGVLDYLSGTQIHADTPTSRHDGALTEEVQQTRGLVHQDQSSGDG